MAQATPEAITTQDVTLKEMTERLSRVTGREITVREVLDEGREGLRILREENRCPVCLEGKVEIEPAVSCGFEFRCNRSLCRYPFTRQEVDKPDYTEDDSVIYLFGHNVLFQKHQLEKRKT